MNPEEIQKQIATLMAEADALNEKAKGEAGLSEEEQARLDELVAQIEQLQKDLEAANTQQRYIAVKERAKEPTRPAPRISVPATPKRNDISVNDAFRIWLMASQGTSPQDHYRAKQLGLDLNGRQFTAPINYRGFAFKERAILSTGGTNTGAEWIWQSYSDKVTEYLTYASPLLGLLSSETTSDGNDRTYFIVDDTAMESTYTSASGGTETNPTIPDTNLVSDNIVIACFDITSGYQKVSFNEVRDSAVNIEDKVAKATSNSHARKMEREVLTGQGNGSTGVGGIEDACTALTEVNAWDPTALETLYFSMPAQYRKDAIWVANGDTYGELYSVLKGTDDHSLFGTTVDQSVEYDVLMGKKFVQSDYVSADTVLFFNPNYYMLRLVQGQIYQQFVEKFFPNIAWASIASFGGAWIGPANAAKKLSLESSSS